MISERRLGSHTNGTNRRLRQLEPLPYGRRSAFHVPVGMRVGEVRRASWPRKLEAALPEKSQSKHRTVAIGAERFEVAQTMRGTRASADSEPS